MKRILPATPGVLPGKAITRRKGAHKDESKWLAKRFEEHRPRLRAVAYRMLGSTVVAARPAGGDRG